MTTNPGYDPKQTRTALRNQISMGRYMILGTVLITVLNIVFLLLNSDVYLTYSAAAAYYLVWLGKGFDNGFAINWDAAGIYTRTGILFALLVLAVYGLLWWRARRQIRWIRTAMILVIADAVLLVIIALFLLENPLDALFDLVIHGAVIWEMNRALEAGKRLRRLSREEVPAPEPEEVPVQN